MFLKFEIENYRSVKSEALLSLAAINYYKEHTNQLIDAKLPGLAGTRFLRAAGIFGPNASGKSTIFRALFIMKSIVLRSATMAADSELPFEPYALEPASTQNPTRFSIAFTSEQTRYEYGFAFTATHIMDEKLCAYPKGREQVWFERRTNKTDDGMAQTSIKGSSFLKIPAALKPLLNDNALLLSLLANYPKYEESTKIQPVIDWFSKELSILQRGPRSAVDYPFSGEIIDGAQGTDFQRSFIQDMMRKADVGISRAKVEKVKLHEFLKDTGVTVDHPELAELITSQNQSEDIKTVVFEHEGSAGKVEFNLDAESEGTFQLFGLSGHVAQALENGFTLFVDEIDASLHPILVREVIRCFLEPKSNPKGAQLVFTAHNPCLLEDDLLRRDQIWLTEKSDGATELYPISDFSPRKDETLSSGYLIGRYSATPLVPACFGRCGVGREDDADGK